MKSSETKINIGCGAQRPVGWINCDCSLNAYLQRFPVIGAIAAGLSGTVYAQQNVKFLNARRRWPWRDDSVDSVYSSHFLEHVTLTQAESILAQCHRVLRPGGVLRVVVPDLRALSEAYLKSDAGPDATREYMWQLNLHRDNVYSDVGLMHSLLALIQGWPHQHKYMYDWETISAIVAHAGFEQVHKCEYGVSTFVHDIRVLECTREGVPSIYLEAKKRER